MSSKNLIAEIEAIHREQREKRSTLPNRYQFDFTFKDRGVFDDSRELLHMQLDVNSDLENRKVWKVLRVFLSKFFNLPMEDSHDSESEDGSDGMDLDLDDHLHEDRGRPRSASLRRNVLTGTPTGPNVPNGRVGSGDEAMDTDEDGELHSIGVSEGAESGLPAGSVDGRDLMDMDTTSTSLPAEFMPQKRTTYVCYGNNAFYVLLRLFQVSTTFSVSLLIHDLY